MLLVNLLVCFYVLVFSLPLGVGGWLRLVIVALPRLFYFGFHKTFILQYTFIYFLFAFFTFCQTMFMI